MLSGQVADGFATILVGQLVRVHLHPSYAMLYCIRGKVVGLSLSEREREEGGRGREQRRQPSA